MPATLVASVHLSAAIRPADPVATPRPRRVDCLADGRDDGIRGQDDGLRFVEARRGLPGEAGPRNARVESDGGDLSAGGLDSGGSQIGAEGHAFFESFGRFPGMGRHFLAAPAVGHFDRFDTRQPPRAAGRIHGDIAAADDHNLRADGRRLAVVDLVEEVQSLPDTLGVFARNPHLAAEPCAGSDEDGVERAVEGLPSGCAGRGQPASAARDFNKLFGSATRTPVLASTPRSRMC